MDHDCGSAEHNVLLKGDGEAQPLLSTRDELADFETWDKRASAPIPRRRT